MRPIIAAIEEHFEGPLATIREAIGPRVGAADPRAPERQHLATVMAMCDDVAHLSRRYLDYLDQVEALPHPRLAVERPDDLLAELDRRLMPESFGRGVAWSCDVIGPIRPILTDRALCLEALQEMASLAVESARPGDSVSLVHAPGRTAADRPFVTLSSSADEVIAELASLREDPLFSSLVCLEEVGCDTGSRLALSLERLSLLDGEVEFDPPVARKYRAIHFRFPALPAPVRP